MPRAAEKRLGRLEAHRPRSPEDKARSRRRLLRWAVAAGATIREAAVAAAIDPATISALQRGEWAAAMLAELGDTPELALADAAAEASDDSENDLDDPGSRASLEVALAWLEQRYAADRDRPMPGGSPMEWLAWARARRPNDAASQMPGG